MSNSTHDNDKQTTEQKEQRRMKMALIIFAIIEAIFMIPFILSLINHKK